MMTDIQRMCNEPTEEDREFFPDIAGRGDAYGVLRDAWANYRDESFIGQFLSPKLMRQLRMFHLNDDPSEPAIRVDAIHNERGYRAMRRALARQHDIGWIDANIEVIDADLAGDRRLVLQHTTLGGNLLVESDAKRILQHLADLWGYEVVLREVAGDALLKEHAASPRSALLAER